MKTGRSAFPTVNSCLSVACQYIDRYPGWNCSTTLGVRTVLAYVESLAFAERPDSVPDGDRRDLRTSVRNMSYNLFRNPYNIVMKITYIGRFYAMNPE